MDVPARRRLAGKQPGKETAEETKARAPLPQAFATAPFDWQRRIVALLQPRDLCRFSAGCKRHYEQKGCFAELHKKEHPHRCAICENVLCHPHRLPDCGHVACGRCIYGKAFPSRFIAYHGWRCQHPSDDWKTCCGVTVRTRPEKLGAEHCTQAGLDAAAHAAMPTAGQREEWRAWHNSRVHPGTHGHFGGDWNVFDGAGFPGDFDGNPSANYRELPQILPEGNEYTLTICPAAENFSGFPPGTVQKFTRADAAKAVAQVVLNESVRGDDIILVTEERGWLDEYGNENEGVVEYVVRGWEELLRNDEAGSEESEEEPGAGDESDMSV